MKKLKPTHITVLSKKKSVKFSFLTYLLAKEFCFKQ